MVVAAVCCVCAVAAAPVCTCTADPVSADAIRSRSSRSVTEGWALTATASYVLSPWSTALAGLGPVRRDAAHPKGLSSRSGECDLHRVAHRQIGGGRALRVNDHVIGSN